MRKLIFGSLHENEQAIYLLDPQWWSWCLGGFLFEILDTPLLPFQPGQSALYRCTDSYSLMWVYWLASWWARMLIPKYPLQHLSNPIGSMYDIFTCNELLLFIENLRKYTKNNHGSVMLFCWTNLPIPPLELAKKSISRFRPPFFVDFLKRGWRNLEKLAISYSKTSNPIKNQHPWCCCFLVSGNN